MFKLQNELNEEIFYLRRCGMSYPEIAKYLDITPEQANDTVNAILDAEMGLYQ